MNYRIQEVYDYWKLSFVVRFVENVTLSVRRWSKSSIIQRHFLDYNKNFDNFRCSTTIINLQRPSPSLTYYGCSVLANIFGLEHILFVWGIVILLTIAWSKTTQTESFRVPKSSHYIYSI